MFITRSIFRGLNLFRSELNLCKSCNHSFRFHHSHSLSKKINFQPILFSYKHSYNNGLFGKLYLSTSSRLYQKDVVDDRMKNLIDETDKSIQVTKRPPRKKGTTKKEVEMLEVIAFSTAEEYNLEWLVGGLKTQGLYDQVVMPEDVDDVIYVRAKYEVQDVPREIYFFREGCVVFWNVPIIEVSLLQLK